MTLVPGASFSVCLLRELGHITDSLLRAGGWQAEGLGPGAMCWSLIQVSALLLPVLRDEVAKGFSTFWLRRHKPLLGDSSFLHWQDRVFYWMWCSRLTVDVQDREAHSHPGLSQWAKVDGPVAWNDIHSLLKPTDIFHKDVAFYQNTILKSPLPSWQSAANAYASRLKSVRTCAPLPKGFFPLPFFFSPHRILCCYICFLV